MIEGFHSIRSDAFTSGGAGTYQVAIGLSGVNQIRNASLQNSALAGEVSSIFLLQGTTVYSADHPRVILVAGNTLNTTPIIYNAGEPIPLIGDWCLCGEVVQAGVATITLNAVVNYIQQEDKGEEVEKPKSILEQLLFP